MKKFLSLITFSLSLSLSVFSQTADEVIEKHLAAIGGKEKLMQLNTLVTEGSLAVQGMDIPIKISQEHSKAQRVEIAVMGMTGYIINTTTEGWSYLPFQGQASPEALPAEVVKESADQLDIQSPLLNYKEKGHTVEFIGKEDVEGTECFKLKIIFKGGAEATMFFDPSTYYMIKQITKSKATGQETTQEQTFSNFTKQEGYTFPFSMTGMGPGGVVSITKIEINKSLEESLFKVPK
jgi:hypothetical protein